jgi:hypothetical protein
MPSTRLTVEMRDQTRQRLLNKVALPHQPGLRAQLESIAIRAVRRR